tara:strand:+ start:181 stop:555 length:375 start_codon:yes stop_codon:yes gene_type:complete
MDKSTFLKYKWEIIWGVSIILLLILPFTAIFFIGLFILLPMCLMGMMVLTNENDWEWTKSEKWPWKRLSFYLCAFWIAAIFIILTDDYSPSSSTSDDEWFCQYIAGEKVCYRDSDGDGIYDEEW